MKIPVFHDDQHGTAIISGAALLNALEARGKRIEEIKIVFNGAGASGHLLRRALLQPRRPPRNIVMCDTNGVIYEGRTEGMNPYKERFAADTAARTLEEAFVGADVFFGLSSAELRHARHGEVDGAQPDHLRPGQSRPRNPLRRCAGRPSRRDRRHRPLRLPNQVNNVLGFPFIFRGALDVRATTINDEMKLAATRALAELAKEDVPDSVSRAYGVDHLRFGREYIIPKPFDPRVLICEASAPSPRPRWTPASPSARSTSKHTTKSSRSVWARPTSTHAHHDPQGAAKSPSASSSPRARSPRSSAPARSCIDEGIAHPILLGSEDNIRANAAELHFH